MDSKEISKTPVKSAGVSLIERLRKGTDHSTECVWPGSDERFLMVVLSCDELQEAEAAAFRRWQDLGLDLNMYTADDFYSELSMQCLYRAMRKSPEDRSRLFGAAEELRSAIEPDERSMLASQYIENQNHSNPKASEIDPETLNAVLEAVKKKDAVALSAFGSSTLAIYLLGMASPQPS